MSKLKSMPETTYTLKHCFCLLSQHEVPKPVDASMGGNYSFLRLLFNNLNLHDREVMYQSGVASLCCKQFTLNYNAHASSSADLVRHYPLISAIYIPLGVELDCFGLSAS